MEHLGESQASSQMGPISRGTLRVAQTHLMGMTGKQARKDVFSLRNIVLLWCNFPCAANPATFGITLHLGSQDTCLLFQFEIQLFWISKMWASGLKSQTYFVLTACFLVN